MRPETGDTDQIDTAVTDRIMRTVITIECGTVFACAIVRYQKF